MIKILNDKSFWLAVVISGIVVLAIGAYCYHWWINLSFEIGKDIISDFNF